MQVVVSLRERYQDFRLFWDDYLSTIEARITGPLGTIFWILSGVLQSKLAFFALAIHVVPLLNHYLRNRPFGIQFQYTPIRSEEDTPDFISAEEDQAILKDGYCRIHAKVGISDSLAEFAIRFESDDNTVVELRDIPEPEHTYDREENELRSDNVSSRRFQLVLEVFDEGQNPSNRGKLNVVDARTERSLTQIELITA